MRKLEAQISENELRAALDKMQVSLIEQNKEQYYLRANLNENEQKLIKNLKISKLPNLLPKSKLINYLG